MNSKTSLIYRLRRCLRLLPIVIYQKLRVWKYKFFSDIHHGFSLARLNQPVLMMGMGRLELGRCIFGVRTSPYFLNGYTYLEARGTSSLITIEDGVCINNNAVIVAEQSNIRIGEGTLIGTDFTVYDSDFHEIRPYGQNGMERKCLPVNIGKNVFIGSRVMVLKGVVIGDGAVIAAGSVVSSNIPSGVVAGGIPARILWQPSNIL